MASWIYILIGILIGGFGGLLVALIFCVPPNAGTLIIRVDPDDQNQKYMFLQSKETPESISQKSFVMFKIDDRTHQRK